MTANKNTPRERNSSNDQLDRIKTDAKSSSELADLTPKQQAIIIAVLEHPNDPAVKIATRVGTAQSYPSQVVDKHSDLLTELRSDTETGDSVVDVIEQELSEREITELVESGLLDGIETKLTEKYTSSNKNNSEDCAVAQCTTSNVCESPTDRPVTAQRSFMSAAPSDVVIGDSNDTESEPTVPSQKNPNIDTNTGFDDHYPRCNNSSGSVNDDEELWQWYNTLTEKQRAIVDAITKNPDSTDTRIAEIVSKKLPSDESVSRAYVSIIQSEDATFLEALQESEREPWIEPDSVVASAPEIRDEDTEHNQTSADTPDNRSPSQRTSIPIEEFERVRDRIAFSANVIEHEYALHQDTTNSSCEMVLPESHVAGTVAFARQALAEMDTLLERSQ